MGSKKRMPRWVYGPARNGLLDPDRITIRERAMLSQEVIDREHARRTSPDPVTRKFQAMTDKATGRKRG